MDYYGKGYNIKNEDVIIHVIVHTQSISHNEQTIRQIIQNILKSATHYSTDQEDYSLVKKVCYLCTEIDAVNVIFQEECKNFKSSIEKRIEDLEKENRLLQSEALREYNYSYFPDIMNRVAQIVHTAYDAYTEDQKPNEYRENGCSILSLMHIRDILQFSIDVQEYHYYEHQDLWDAMYQTPGTFIIRKRSDNVAGKLAISVIKSDILSGNPESKSTGSQQPQKNAVDKGKNIMNNRHASTEHSISNNYKGGEMHGSDQDTKSIEKRLLGAIESIDVNQVKGLVEKDTNVTESILSEALKKANERIANLGKGSKKKQSQENRLTQIIKLLKTKPKSIGVSTTELPVGDDEEKQSPDQPTEHTTLQTDDKRESESKNDQPDSPSHSSGSSTDGNGYGSSSSSFIKVLTSSEGDTGSGSSFEEVGEDENVFTPKSSSPQDVQPGISTSKPSGTGAEGDKKKQTPVQPAKDIAQINDDNDYDLSWLFSEEDDNNRQEDPHPTPEPTPAPEPTPPSLTSKKTEQVSNAAPQNTKSSNLHIIATSILAIAGVALGVTIAVHLEMLAVGIVVGACCLVAAAVMYHYRWPSSFIEANKVEKVDPTRRKNL